MVSKMKTLCLLFCLLCLGCPVRAALLPLDTPLSARLRDRAGTVWAIYRGGYAGTIYRQEKKGWQEVKIPNAAGTTATSLMRGDDGSIYAYWQTQNETPARSLITVHRGLTTRVLARLTALPLSNWNGNAAPLLWAGAKGDVWLSGNVPTLYHVTAGGDVTPFPLKAEQYKGGHLPDSFFQVPMSSVVDGQGRRWFWQAGGFWPPGGLRGFLVWDGKTMAYHATLPDFPETPGVETGLPQNSFLTLAPLDAHHLWLSVLGFRWGNASHGGLYRLDTDTLAAVRETPPMKEAFLDVTQVFRANGDWYVVESANRGDRVPLLWRSNGNRWEACLTHLEETAGYNSNEVSVPWQAEPSGVWIGAPAGLWWIPKSRAPAVWVGWQRGLNANAGSLSSGVADPPLSPPPVLPPRPGVMAGGKGEPPLFSPPFADLRHHLWATHFYNTQTPSLDEWDGMHWRKHLMPKAVTGAQSLFACDTFGRIWLSTSNWHPPAQPQPVDGYAVYDPSHDTWTNYATKQNALQAAAALPGMGFVPRHDLYKPPLFSGDGRVTYLDNNTGIYLYDGHSWKRWEAHDVKPGYQYGNIGSGPEFNAEGNLQVALPDDTWEYTQEAVWQPTGRQAVVTPQPPFPSGGPKNFWGPLLTDELGAGWVPLGGDVYETWHGLWVKQAALSGRGSPFWDGRSIDDVLRDPVGRLFFVTRPGGYYDFVVWTPPATPPAPRIRVTPLAADAVALNFTPAKAANVKFLWRLNGGQWSTPGAADSAVLQDLAPGDYRVEAQAIDTILRSSARPSSAAFTIRPASPSQIARWVQTLLSGSDDAREGRCPRLEETA